MTAFDYAGSEFRRSDAKRAWYAIPAKPSGRYRKACNPAWRLVMKKQALQQHTWTFSLVGRKACVPKFSV
jgi:hypothetical protein